MFLLLCCCTKWLLLLLPTSFVLRRKHKSPFMLICRFRRRNLFIIRKLLKARSDYNILRVHICEYLTVCITKKNITRCIVSITYDLPSTHILFAPALSQILIIVFIIVSIGAVGIDFKVVMLDEVSKPTFII